MPIFRIKMDRAMMKAQLLVSREGDSDSFTRERILDFIRNAGVKAGIIDEQIDKIVLEQLFEEEILVACGRDPIPGDDGTIKYEFDPKPKISPEIRKDGTVDFMNLNLMQKVVLGQILARAIPPTSGVAGFDLSGRTIPALAGKPVTLDRGLNTSYADGSGNILKSDVRGHVHLNSDKIIEVATVYEVKGDVNYTIGSIDYDGDVVIHGDVLSGFKVTATGEVEIKGVVEDAHIEAGKSVLIRGGFIGSGKGSIKAAEDVVVRYVHHQEIIAGRDIIIANEAMNCRLTAGHELKMTAGAGVLVGGTATVGLCVECKTIGNEKQTKTEISIPFHSDIQDKITEMEKLITTTETKLKKIDQTLRAMEDADQNTSLVDKARQQVYGNLYKAQHDLRESIVCLNEELGKLHDELATSLGRLYIRAIKSIFPGVTLAVGENQLQIQEPMERQHFVPQNDQIVGIELKRDM